MDPMRPPIDSQIDSINVELFAESFLKSRLASAMHERGEPLKFFMPVHRSDCAAWDGVEITIAGVTRERIESPPETSSARERGNGYSANPHGPLHPGDFGVHSHPDTRRLLGRSTYAK